MLPVAPDSLWWLAAVPLIAVLHELGHALAAGPAGYRVTSFGVGHGKPLLRWRLRSGTIVYLGRWLVSGGLCVAIPVEPVPARRWLYHSGGLIFQGLLALLLWPLAGFFPVLENVFWFNLAVIAWNLVPVRVGDYATDGWQLLADLFRPATTGHVFTARAQVERVLRFESRVGSPLGVTWCRLTLRWMDIVVGLDDDDWRPDEVMLMAETQLEALHGYVTAERHRVEGRSLAALHTVRELRRAWGAHLPPLALDMLTVAEARAFIAQEEPKLAQQAIARLAGAKGVVAHDAAAIELAAALQLADVEVVEVAARRLIPLLDGGMLDAPEAVRSVWDASAALKEEGRLTSAEDLGREARAAARHLIASAAPQDKVSIAARLGEVAGVTITHKSAGP